MLKSVEYIQKIIISFLTVPLDEINNGVTRVKLGKSKTSHSQLFCKMGILKNFAKFTEIHLCRTLFFNKVASEL